MKKLFTLLTALLLAVCTKALAQGWPQNYDGVMLQGFYWDSYDDTRWTTLEGQATELAASFNQIWVPQSGYCNTTHMQMGYLPIWWFNHLSAFGTEAELRQMIKTFKSKGTGIIEDVVISHRVVRFPHRDMERQDHDMDIGRHLRQRRRWKHKEKWLRRKWCRRYGRRFRGRTRPRPYATERSRQHQGLPFVPPYRSRVRWFQV